MNISPFATRSQANYQLWKLREQYLKLRTQRDCAYASYIYELTKLMPHDEENAMSARELAAKLTENQKERDQITNSIRSLAKAAENARAHRESPTRSSVKRPELPKMRSATRRCTLHFAQLDDNGNVISQFDKKKNICVYYLGEK